MFRFSTGYVSMNILQRVQYLVINDPYPVDRGNRDVDEKYLKKP